VAGTIDVATGWQQSLEVTGCWTVTHGSQALVVAMPGVTDAGVCATA